LTLFWQIEFQDGLLTVLGEYMRRPELNDANRKWHRNERKYGLFKRQIQLPKGVDHTMIRAVNYNGLLTITIPKHVVEATTAHTVPIQMALPL
jgi:HSP20 family protein